MQGLSFGPADLAASRRMKTTRVGGGHPGYLVRTDPDPTNPDAPRVTAQQDPWHYTLARMVDACTANGIYPYYGPFGDIKDTLACEDQFRASFLLGCVGAWSLHPVQIDIAKKVFTPPVDEVRWARRVIAEMGDGSRLRDDRRQDAGLDRDLDSSLIPVACESLGPAIVLCQYRVKPSATTTRCCESSTWSPRSPRSATAAPTTRGAPSS